MKFMLEHENPSSKVEAIKAFPFHFTFLLVYNTVYLTPIHLAAYFGLTGVIEKQTIKFNINPLIADNPGKWSPIHFAAMNGQLNTVEYLAGFTDTPNAPNNDGYTPIHLAARNGQLNTVEYLSSWFH